jgi:hypothetical protein
MRGRVTRQVRKVERRVNSPKLARTGKGKSRVGRILEEWLAEAQIRYTHAGD